MTTIEIAPDNWLENAGTLLRIAEVITPGVASKILRQFVDVSVRCSLDGEQFDPRALSDAIAFATGWYES